MTITADVSGFDKLAAEFEMRAGLIYSALYQKIFSLCIQVQSKVQGNLASGIGLKSRHGAAGLAGSVRALEPNIEGDLITGSVEGAGGPFWYGAMWERTGHREIVPVTKKALHFFVEGKEVFARRVAAQSARPWMVPPFQQMQPYIVEQIQATAQAAATGTEEAT
jgi:hypothetical protein